MTTPMTGTGGGREGACMIQAPLRGGEMLRGGLLGRELIVALPRPLPRLPRVSIHAAAALSLLLLSGCLGNDPPPVSALPTTAAACEALRPAFPITYSGKSDTPETVKQVRAANARFLASCP